ncbi:hypothetical protein RSOL_393080, partial [Rhizoctonia solani AG-3 Rhs1AP]
MPGVVFPWSSCLALTPHEARQGLDFIYQVWLCFFRRHNAEITPLNEFHPDILERYMIPYRDIVCTKVMGEDTFYLTDRTAASLHDAIIATWVMVGQATVPDNWDPLYPAYTPPSVMFALWHDLGIKVPPFPMSDLSNTIFVHSFRSVGQLWTVIHQIQFWAIIMRELARLYACYMRTPGWERYSQAGVQTSLAMQNAIHSTAFAEFIEAYLYQYDHLPEDLESTTSSSDSSTAMPLTPESLPPPPLIPEDLLSLLSKEFTKEEDLFPFLQVAEELSPEYEEASFPTLDPVPVMPLTYSVAPPTGYKPYPQEPHNPDNASGPLLSEGKPLQTQQYGRILTSTSDEVKEEASEDSHDNKENIPPSLASLLPPIPPVPAAWETWDQGIGKVRHKCNMVIYCAYCSWVQETDLDVQDPLIHYVDKG